jgi:hypothetical protein
VCNKQKDKYDLYRFKLKKQVANDMFIENTVENFDICKRCYRKIVKQISKESD